MSRSYSDEIKQDNLNLKGQSAKALQEHNHSKSADLAVEGVRAPNIAQRIREEFEAIQHTLHEKHDKGHTAPDIRKRGLSEKSEVMDVKAPALFQRVKEEVEAVAETLHENHDKMSHKIEENGIEDTTTGCWTHMGRAFEKFCGTKEA